jgi:hypothetical protein
MCGRIYHMAMIFPNNPTGAISPETLKIFRLLKRLPDETYAVWQRLAIWSEPGPDFWVLRRDGRSALLIVSSATAQDARNANQLALFETGRGSIGMSEQDALVRFAGVAALPDAPLFGRVPAMILFPSVPNVDLAQATPARAPGVAWASKDDLAPERFLAWLEERLGAPLTPDQIDQLRKRFAPEVVVPPTLTVRQLLRRDTRANLTEYLLSYDQEWALKADLDLSDEAQAASGDMGIQLVSGVAGSGKSLLVIYRARLLHQFFPQKRILVLTHNRPLILDLEARYRRLSAGDSGAADRSGPPIEWRTFHGWCQAHWPADEPRRRPIRAERRAALITQAWHTHLADTAISERMLAEEIDWLKDRLIATRQEYLAADRTGRSFGLNETMRQRMYAAIAAYGQAMSAQELYDYGDVPRGMWLALREERAQPPRYDFILVDEAQFFAPIWFEILKLILKPSGRLFVVADPSQGFLKRRQSWLASGLSVRGRTHRLERSYRTTRAILDFATRWYQLRLPGDEEAIMAPNLQQMPAGSIPQIIALDSEQDEITRVVNEIRALCAGGVPLEHILVLHAEWKGVERLLERLRHEFGAAAVANPKQLAPGKHIRVCTLNAATGLESPIVFVMGLHTLCEAEQSVRLSEEERAEVLRDNTRKLYMAFTRAGQRLAITYVGVLPKVFSQLNASTLAPTLA